MASENTGSMSVVMTARAPRLALSGNCALSQEVKLSIVVSRDLQHDGLRAAGAAMVWALFFHGCVVLMRLYTMRTRLFGDDKLL